MTQVVFVFIFTAIFAMLASSTISVKNDTVEVRKEIAKNEVDMVYEAVSLVNKQFPDPTFFANTGAMSGPIPVISHLLVLADPVASGGDTDHADFFLTTPVTGYEHLRGITAKSKGPNEEGVSFTTSASSFLSYADSISQGYWTTSRFAIYSLQSVEKDPYIATPYSSEAPFLSTYLAPELNSCDSTVGFLDPGTWCGHSSSTWKKFETHSYYAEHLARIKKNQIATLNKFTEYYNKYGKFPEVTTGTLNMTLTTNSTTNYVISLENAIDSASLLSKKGAIATPNNQSNKCFGFFMLRKTSTPAGTYPDLPLTCSDIWSAVGQPNFILLTPSKVTIYSNSKFKNGSGTDVYVASELDFT